MNAEKARLVLSLALLVALFMVAQTVPRSERSARRVLLADGPGTAQVMQQLHAGASQSRTGELGMPSELLPLASEMAHEVFRFWRDHGPDPEHGGFHGTLHRR